MLGFPTRRSLITWCFLSLVWGSTWLFIKIGLEDIPPFTFAGIRFIVAFVVLGVFVLSKRPELPKAGRDWWIIAGTGMLGVAGSYGFVYWGEQYISSGLTALLFAGFPLFGILVAHFVLAEERLTFLKGFGAIVGLAGVGVLFSDQLDSAGALAFWGSLAIVAGAFTAACGDVSVKRWGGHIDPLILACGHMAMGAVPLTSIGLIREGSPLSHAWTPRAILSLVYLAVVGSAIAFVLFFWLLQQVEAGQTMMIGLVTPLIAVMVGVVVLGEPLTWRIAVGGGAILAGVSLALVRSTR